MTALSISITKNMPDTDSPISLVVARSLMATKTKMSDECSMNKEPDPFGFLNQINPIRKIIAARIRAGEVLCELIATHIDRCDETIGDATVPHMCNQRIDRRLPSGLGDPRSDFGSGNDPCISFRQ